MGIEVDNPGNWYPGTRLSKFSLYDLTGATQNTIREETS